jgi:hypothetical protein
VNVEQNLPSQVFSERGVLSRHEVCGGSLKAAVFLGSGDHNSVVWIKGKM